MLIHYYAIQKYFPLGNNLSVLALCYVTAMYDAISEDIKTKT